MPAVSWTYNLVDGSSVPIADVTVWVTTDSAGTNTVSSGLTDSFGNVTFSLNAGTYYVWSHKSGWNFTSPDTEVVPGSGAGTGTLATAGIVNGYCTLADLRTVFNVPAAITATDQLMIDAINAASRWIDQYCMRVFYKTSGATRYFATERADQVSIDDLLVLTSLATDTEEDKSYSTIWTSADYWKDPINGGVDGIPYTRIEVTGYNGLLFPVSNRWNSEFRIKIVGDWGFCSATPAPVVTACRILSARYYDRKNLIFEQGGGMGASFKKIGNDVDSDVKNILSQYRRYVQ